MKFECIRRQGRQYESRWLNTFSFLSGKILCLTTFIHQWTLIKDEWIRKTQKKSLKFRPVLYFTSFKTASWSEQKKITKEFNIKALRLNEQFFLCFLFLRRFLLDVRNSLFVRNFNDFLSFKSWTTWNSWDLSVHFSFEFSPGTRWTGTCWLSCIERPCITCLRDSTQLNSTGLCSWVESLRHVLALSVTAWR